VDLSFLKAAPIGLILFIGSYLSARRRKSARAQSTERLPKLAPSLNLTHHAPRSPGDIGALSGQFGGYDVRIDPDEAARISLRFSGAPRVALRTFSFLKRAPQSFQVMTTAYRQFNAYFVERYASDAVITALLKMGDLDQEVAKLRASPQPIETLSISDEGIDCRLQFERVVAVSAEAVEYLLPVLVHWAQAIDSAVELPADSDPDA
jgi:hypothetical protein